MVSYPQSLYYYVPLFLQIFFASSKPEKNAKKCCTQSEKLMVSLTLQWVRGVPVLILSVESFNFKLLFICILALKLDDKERVMEGVVTMPLLLLVDGVLGNKNQKCIRSSQYKFHDCLSSKDRF